MFTICNRPRIILHAKAACRDGYERVIVSCRDTDVLVLLSPHTLCRETKSRPVHNIELTPTLQENILSYHAVTGCDTVSQLSGQGKNDMEGIREAQCTAQWPWTWHTFRIHNTESGGVLLSNRLTKFWENKYKCVSYRMFQKGSKEQEKFPPTRTSLEQPINNAHY